MPTIAIAPCRQMADYVESIRRAGAEVVELTSTEAPESVVGRVDGVLLTGGGDIDPALYGAAAHATFEAAEPGRDAFEIALVRAALAADLPVLAICRGMQVLSVAFGGDLVQDIPSEVNGALHHDVREPRYAIAHEVWVSPTSRLAARRRRRATSARRRSPSWRSSRSWTAPRAQSGSWPTSRARLTARRA